MFSNVSLLESFPIEHVHHLSNERNSNSMALVYYSSEMGSLLKVNCKLAQFMG